MPPAHFHLLILLALAPAAGAKNRALSLAIEGGTPDFSALEAQALRPIRQQPVDDDLSR